MTRQERLFTYSREISGFRLGAERPDDGGVLPDPGADVRAMRLLRSAGDAGKSSLILFGLASPEFAVCAARALDSGMDLTVCDVDPQAGRALLLSPDSPFSRPGGPAGLLCDDSDWAIFCLLRQAGLRPGDCLTAINGAGLPPIRKKRLMALRRLFDGSGSAMAEAGRAPDGEGCDFAAIVHPGEPDLEGFFRSIPAFCKRVVLVWDGNAPPEASQSPALAGREVVQLVRPLAGDFSAQRNLMLSACKSEWVLYLDADERAGPVMEALLPGLLGLPFSGFLFPRMTFYPDPGRVKVGFGLWPDPQLRLFRRAGARFVNPVHERIEGLPGPLGLALWAPIHHLSNLQKDAGTLAGKLAVFDRAGGLRHRLNAEYPSLPASFFEPAGVARVGEIAVLPAG